ncbi:MAG TPA: diguanylate cyclase [Nitrospirota bacterium]|nr:diguanylate cyclase [Nitrospirota bacterium]
MVRFIQRSLELRIAVALVIVLAAVIGGFTAMDIRIMRKDTIRTSERNLAALAGTVKGNVIAAMRRGNHLDVQRIIEEARSSFGIDRIVIYDEEGKLLRRSGIGPGERTLPIPPSVLAAIASGDRSDLHDHGTASLSYYSPIANQAPCYRCHGSDRLLNGILRIDFSLQGIEPLITARRNSILLWTTIMVALLMTVLVALLRHFVHTPVEELRRAMARAEAGDENILLPDTGSDELAVLQRGFISMLDRINSLHRANFDKEKELAHNREAMRFRNELQSMFNAMPDGVLLVDTSMRIIQSNPRVYELVPALEKAGGVIKPDCVQKECCPFRGIGEVLKSAAMMESQCSISLRGGDARHLHSICAPVMEEGRVAYVVQVVRDITERVKTERELEERTSELVAANRLLSQLAQTDSLTEVSNRRYFDELLDREIKGHSRRKNSQLSLMMIDIDHFKLLNDRLGHLAGDTVLRELAKMLGENVRETDTVARFGGEEFVIVMPDTHLDGAGYHAEVLRKKVEARPFPGPDGPVRMTVSIGVAAYVSGSPSQEVLRSADRALYEAKEGGRNRVVVIRPEAVVKEQGSVG